MHQHSPSQHCIVRPHLKNKGSILKLFQWLAGSTRFCYTVQACILEDLTHDSFRSENNVARRKLEFCSSKYRNIDSLLQNYYLLVFHFTTSEKIFSSDFFLFHNKFINLVFPWFSFYFWGLVTLIMMICRQGLFLELFGKKHSLTKPLFHPSLHKTHILSRSS